MRIEPETFCLQSTAIRFTTGMRSSSLSPSMLFSLYSSLQPRHPGGCSPSQGFGGFLRALGFGGEVGAPPPPVCNGKPQCSSGARGPPAGLLMCCGQSEFPTITHPRCVSNFRVCKQPSHGGPSQKLPGGSVEPPCACCPGCKFILSWGVSPILCILRRHTSGLASE